MTAEICKIVRQDYSQFGTPGIFYLPSEKKLCETLERPKLFQGHVNLSDNTKTAINESCCIPEGNYVVSFNFSAKFQRKMFIIEEVDGRTGIRFHNANNIDQLLGCIAPCFEIKNKINGYEFWADYGKYNGRARDFITEVFERNLPKTFKLQITSIETEKACNA